MSGKDSETLQVFVEESLEHLADIEQDLLELEKNSSDVDKELVNKIFRAAHSIKGGAGFIGLSNIRELSHKMENVLGVIRNRKIVPNVETVNVLLLASDKLKEMLTGHEINDEEDIALYTEALDSLLSASVSEVSDESGITRDPDGIRVIVPDTESSVKLPADFVSRAQDEGNNVFILQVHPEDAKYADQSTEEIIDQLKEYGAALLLAVLDKQGGSRANANAPLFVAFACILELDETASLLDLDRSNVLLFDFDSHSIRAPSKDAAPADKFTEETIQATTDESTVIARKNERANQTETVPFQSHINPAISIRVKVQLVESLINLAGELVLSRNQLLQAIAAENSHLIGLVAQKVDQITSELQDKIMLTRMQSIGRLLDKFPRMVRDIARTLGKEVEIKIGGSEVEIDRTLLEAINDPMTHLVRNAIDHGIENALERKRLGKAEIGKVSVKAFHQAAQVVIEIADDGRGLVPEHLASAAVAKGFITEQQAKKMNAEEKTDLIFLPGFSLAERVSELSGRGVGMDVVKTNIEKLGGQIELHSLPGKGVNIRIRLPLTLAVVAAQMVAAEDEQYAIPQQNIEELIRIPASLVKERVELIGEAPVVRLRGRLLPLVRLADILCIDRTYTHRVNFERASDRRFNIADRRSQKHAWPLRDSAEPVTEDSNDRDSAERRRSDRRFHASSALNIAVVSAGAMSYGLIVDRFLDSQELIVKPLGSHLRKCRVYAGVTIMGDGRVTLILDVASMAMEANLAAAFRAGKAVQELTEKTHKFRDDENLIDVLLFANPNGENFAVPLSHVIRIEKIKKTDIEFISGMRVVKRHGGNLPVFSLDETAKVQSFEQSEELKIIIFNLLDREMGLIASGSLDAAKAPAKMDAQTFRQPGISGSGNINEKITLMVDLRSLVETLHPTWFSDTPEGHPREGATSGILVVEDSNFFRGQIRQLLEEEGFPVFEAEDGESAWDLLQQEGQEVRLIVTDLEMPRLDGFQLAKRIREDDRFSTVPLIALTTLADDADMERAKKAGIDDYQIKLDTEQFIATVRSHLNK